MLTDVCSGGGIGGIGVALATQVLSLLALATAQARTSAYTSTPQHTPAYVSIRSVYLRLLLRKFVALATQVLSLLALLVHKYKH